jgi:hypothetical protein
MQYGDAGPYRWVGRARRVGRRAPAAVGRRRRGARARDADGKENEVEVEVEVVECRTADAAVAAAAAANWLPPHAEASSMRRQPYVSLSTRSCCLARRSM